MEADDTRKQEAARAAGAAWARKQLEWAAAQFPEEEQPRILIEGARRLEEMARREEARTLTGQAFWLGVAGAAQEIGAAAARREEE